MASIDSLPADQRAVLELVLRRGRSYDEIAQLLSIDRAGVRQRALAALDSLGPQTRVAPDRRALITDYLLDALPGGVAEEVRSHLGASASERAWARAVASELEGVSASPLPEIPSNGRGSHAPAAPAKAPRAGKGKRGSTAERRRAAEVPPAAALSNGSPRERGPRRPVSRLGGAVLLAIAAAVAIALVLVFVVFTGSATHRPAHRAAGTPRPNGTTRTAGNGSSAASPSTATTASGIKLLAQINLKAPNGAAKPVGIAYAVAVQGKKGIVLRAAGLAANSKRPPTRYAVWLSSASGGNYLLGVVKNAVGRNGQLVTGGGLPTTAGRYQQLLVTLETRGNPSKPGPVVLAGTVKGL